jgi:hypothetical protein
MSTTNDRRYIASDGTVLTDELVERLASEAGSGFTNSTLEPVEGCPWETDRLSMRSHAIRVPDALWSLVEREVKKRHMSVSEYTRQSLANNITPQQLTR